MHTTIYKLGFGDTDGINCKGLKVYDSSYTAGFILIACTDLLTNTFTAVVFLPRREAL
jgi:hypothetical protein